MQWRVFSSRHLIDLVLVFLLLVLGIIKYADIPIQEQRRIELETGLEQLYVLEQAFNKKFDRYFDPTDAAEGFDWVWMEGFEWEVNAGPTAFGVLAKADLDGDGVTGIWRVDERSPQVHVLVED